MYILICCIIRKQWDVNCKDDRQICETRNKLAIEMKIIQLLRITGWQYRL